MDIGVAAIIDKQDELGWKASRMAAELGLAKSHYSELVNGKRRLSLRVARKAYKLGVAPINLLTEGVYGDSWAPTD